MFIFFTNITYLGGCMNISSYHPVASLKELCVENIVARADYRTVRESQNSPPSTVSERKPGRASLSELIQKVEEASGYVGYSDNVKSDLAQTNYLTLRNTCESLVTDMRPLLVLEEARKLNSYERVNDELLRVLPLNCTTLIVGPRAQVVNPHLRENSQLEVLRLQSCTELKELDATPLKNLKVLTVSNCPKLEKVSLACQAVAELALVGCPALSEVEVKEEKRSLNAEVRLEDLDKLAALNLAEAQNLPRLEPKNCPQLKLSAVKQSRRGNVVVPRDRCLPGRLSERYPDRMAYIQPGRARHV